MPHALTPATAAAYLRELSADARAVVVLDAAGEPLAGCPRAASAAGTLSAQIAPAAGARVDLPGARVFVRRSALHGVVVTTSGLALPGLMWHDLGAVLAALDPASALAASSGSLPAEAVRVSERLLDHREAADAAIAAAAREVSDAVRRGSEPPSDASGRTARVPLFTRYRQRRKASASETGVSFAAIQAPHRRSP